MRREEATKQEGVGGQVKFNPAKTGNIAKGLSHGEGRVQHFLR